MPGGFPILSCRGSEELDQTGVTEALQRLSERIRAAALERRAVRIRGGGSKDFYGGPPQGELLETASLAGPMHYEPTELVITARAATPLATIDRTLSEHGQMLAFEPPSFGERATIGGAVASGLCGPRRAHCGALRDFVLGVQIIDGRGDVLRFGGRVIKNVAGFDVARLMAGSLGTLGLLTEVTLKTTPRPKAECSLRFELDQPRALECMSRWASRPLPLSATAWHDGELLVRLSGAQAAVQAARRSLGGETVAGAKEYWEALREQRLEFFRTAQTLWRISLPAHTPPLPQAEILLEWGGALRWLRGTMDAHEVRSLAARFGGHATLFRGVTQSAEGPFHPLSPAMLALHRRLKAVFDPLGLFNPGRLYPTL